MVRPFKQGLTQIKELWDKLYSIEPVRYIVLPFIPAIALIIAVAFGRAVSEPSLASAAVQEVKQAAKNLELELGETAASRINVDLFGTGSTFNPSDDEIPYDIDDSSLVQISAKEFYDGEVLSVYFSIESLPEDCAQVLRYEWSPGFGNEKIRNTDSINIQYPRPGNYSARLRIQDVNGNIFYSNRVDIGFPYPTNEDSRYLTLTNQDLYFSIDGTLEGVYNYSSVEESPIVLITEDGGTGTYKADQPGYYKLFVRKNNSSDSYNLYLFVSPIASVINDRNDFDWYETQYQTGSPSNCGPASVSMCIRWARGSVNLSENSAMAIRDIVGWKGDGATSFEELLHAFHSNRIDAEMVNVYSPQSIFNIIDDGSIGIILIKTLSIRPTMGSPAYNYYGRYYPDDVGHYVVVKGYTEDGRYLIVNDPIPSDWMYNSLRYTDGVSMIGKNRYYPIEDIMGGLMRHQVLRVRRDINS